MARVRQLRLEVTSACQNSCSHCAFDSGRRSHPDFDLSLSDLDRFIRATFDSGYSIETLRIHGLGEPLLWRNLNEGLLMLQAAGIAKSIVMASNGLALGRLEPAAWDCLTALRVSVYPPYTVERFMSGLSEAQTGRLQFLLVDRFAVARVPGDAPAKTPCDCMCRGPMVIGDKVFYHCGPPVFGAAAELSLDPYEELGLVGPLGLRYLGQRPRSLSGRLPLCGHCWANGKLQREFAPHLTRTKQGPGRSEALD